jgi:hypothetical protein
MRIEFRRNKKTSQYPVLRHGNAGRKFFLVARPQMRAPALGTLHLIEQFRAECGELWGNIIKALPPHR